MKDSISYFLNPALVTLVLMSLLVVIVLAMAGGDPITLARLGSFYYENDPVGSQGYDGQFVYYIAINPQPDDVASYLDVPAYRYQRILFPILARVVSLGILPVIPWVLPVLGIISQTVGTLLVGELLAGWGVSRWYALVYGLWVGFGLAIRLDLPEPLAYSLVVGAIFAHERRRTLLSWVLYGLAMFAKEVTVLFVLAAVLSYLSEKRWKDALGIGLVAGLPFLLFQVWLWQTFGAPGIGSGGAMATPFEIIPFMGLLRIGSSSMVYLLAMTIVFVPTIILPVVWGIWVSIRKLLAQQVNVVVLALLLNAIAVMLLPFSTFRETGGLLRFTCGLVLAVILYAGRYRVRRVLNYSWFWLSLNVFLFKTGGLL
jgi:hypothetical protein